MDWYGVYILMHNTHMWKLERVTNAETAKLISAMSGQCGDVAIVGPAKVFPQWLEP